MHAKYEVSFCYASKIYIANVIGFNLPQMVFDINWAIFRIKVTFKGHMALTLVSLEKVLLIECTCHT